MDLYVNDTLTVGKAILRAGGFAEFANKKKVKLMRGTNQEGQARQSFELDMNEILEQGKSEKDMNVLPDDFIVVPSRILNF
jgi:protein involved in polysaccharide export with SLBB domain